MLYNRSLLVTHLNVAVCTCPPQSPCCCYLVAKSSLTLCDPMDCSMPGFPVLDPLLEFAQTYVHWVGDAVQPFCPLSSLLLLPSIFPSIRVFSSELPLCIRWPQDWSFSFSISPSNEYSELISFRTNGFYLPVCSPGDSQESFPTPQFKSISSSALSLLYGPTLTSIRDYWKNYSSD